MIPTFGLPIVDTLRSYSRRDLWPDASAGLTVALLAVPQCMAYALIAKLPPEYGLYAAIVTVIIGGLLGSSSRIITGPTAKIALVVGGVLIGVSAAGRTEAVVVLCVMVGVFQILFAVLKIGNLARFVSQAVITGFIMGGAIVIIGDQVFYLLGVDASKPVMFIGRAVKAVQKLLTDAPISPLSLGFGAGAVLLILATRLIDDRIPGSLLSILLAGILVFALDLGDRMEIVGEIPGGIPPLQFASLDPDLWAELFSGALSITILCSVQSVSIGKSIAADTLESFDENQELLGQGLANLATGFLTGFPVSASFSRSFLNHQLGARSRMSAVFCGGFVVLFLLVGSSLVYYVPVAALSGIIIVVVGDVLDVEEIRAALKATRNDRMAFLVTFAGMLTLKLDWAIYLGVFTSLVFYLRSASELDLKEYIIKSDGDLKHINDHRDRIEVRVAILDVNGEAFFGAAEQIKTRIRRMVEESDELKVIVLRLKNTMNLDVDAARVLLDIDSRLKQRGKTLMLCGTTPEIRDVLKQAGVAEAIGRDKILVAQKDLGESTRQALDRARAHIDTVLEGEKEREEEDQPPLKHTIEHLEKDDDEKVEEQTPIDEERVQPED